MSQGIPGNKIKTQNTIAQSEHQDEADAKRVLAVDADGNVLDETNPPTTLTSFILDGNPQQVTEDTSIPANNRPLPVKLTGFDGDVVVNAENLNLETQSDGEYDSLINTNPDSIGVVAHERGISQDKTNQTQRVTAKRGTTDTDTVAQDISMHDALGNAYALKNPLFVTGLFEKFFQLISASKWMDLAVYDQVIPTYSNLDETLTMSFKEDGALLGEAVINLNSLTSWNFQLNRYVNNDDGTVLLDDDSTALNLD